MFYEEVYQHSLWSINAEVKASGLLIARLSYAQIKGGYMVEAGGWGDRNNLEVVVAGLNNITQALQNAAQHTYFDEQMIERTNWQVHMQKRYGKDHVASVQMKVDDAQP